MDESLVAPNRNITLELGHRLVHDKLSEQPWHPFACPDCVFSTLVEWTQRSHLKLRDAQWGKYLFPDNTLHRAVFEDEDGLCLQFLLSSQHQRKITRSYLIDVGHHIRARNGVFADLEYLLDNNGRHERIGVVWLPASGPCVVEKLNCAGRMQYIQVSSICTIFWNFLRHEYSDVLTNLDVTLNVVL